ncbi:unnamed protein product [Adineta steineri]|uniref:SHSP domain-containing protein n=1 Tax=Adineta steineri TaxID=433720 RepID=A0A813NYJ9_9BILA|nr:unnamed protein product [Adineta steineri]CAF3476373.1 unnamed protein product [Adineta steineri]
MSSITSSSVPRRPYIGAHRNRHYINNSLTPALSLSNENSLSATSLSKSIQSSEKNDLLNKEVTDILQTQQEEKTSVEQFSSTTLLDERQLHQLREQKAKGFLPSSSSSSLSLFPTTHNVTPLSYYDHSPPSYAKEQQHFHHPPHQYEQHSYWQLPLSSENKNNQFLLLEDSQPQIEERQKHKQSPTNSLSTRNQNVELSDIPEEKNSFSSLFSLSDTIVQHTDNHNQSNRITSTPILSSLTSYRLTTDKNNCPSLTSDKNNNSKSFPVILDNLPDQSSSISSDNFLTNFQNTTDIRELNNMSYLSSSSVRHSPLILNPYDQRISDQGTKYIIQLKTDEYQENEFIITPRSALNQLIIDAKHREEDSSGGYIHRELRKIFIIPKHIDLNQYAYTYNKTTQELTIEMPYLQTPSIITENKNDLSLNSTIRNKTEPPLTYSYENRNHSENILPTNVTRSNYSHNSNNIHSTDTTTTDSTLLKNSNTAVTPTYETSIGNTKPFDFDVFHRSAFRPQIVRTTSNEKNITNNTNEKKLLMSLDLSDYQAEDIKVTVKDRDLIVNAERKIESGTRKSRSSFYQSTNLPPQTDIEHLQTNFIDGKLIIEAPYLEQNNSDRRIKPPMINNINSSGSSSSHNQGSNWRQISESYGTSTIDDLFQHRTATFKEFVRVRGLRTHFST